MWLCHPTAIPISGILLPLSSGPTSIGRKELSFHLHSSRGLGILERECWLSSVGSGTLAWYQFSQAAVSLSLEISSSSRHPLHLMNDISRIDGEGNSGVRV